MSEQALPPVARAVAEAIVAAVDAARGQEQEPFEEATARLADLDRAPVTVVLGAIVQALLERTHPDGISTADLQEIIRRCAQRARWYPGADPSLLVPVVTGSLGVHGDDPQPQIDRPALLRHAVLLVTELLAAGRLSLRPVLAESLEAIRRDETVESP